MHRCQTNRPRALLLLASIALLLAPAAPAAAATVKILTSTLAGTILGGDADDDLDAFYRDLGATSSLLSGAVTPAELVGVDLFVVMLPDDAFTTAEQTALADYVANGGRLLLMGDRQGFSATENGHLDALLAALGSGMSLGSDDIDPGLQNTVPAQILDPPSVPWNDGVLVVNYGNVNSIAGVPAGNELFLTSDLVSVWGGYEQVGNGEVVLLADVNVISNLEDFQGNDNHVFFANLAGVETVATTVRILTSLKAGEISGGDADNDLDAFYRGEGVSSSLWPAEVTPESLDGVELLVVMVPDDAFTAAELLAMGDHLAGGGTILFIGEQDGFAATENGHIDAALSALGSGMSLDSLSLDPGFRDTVPQQILPHPLNDGVLVVNYGNVNATLGVPPGGGLFLASDLSTPWGAVEDLVGGGGRIVLLADLNVISNLEDTGGNDNHVFFLNVVPSAPVPGLGPVALGVLAGSLLALALWGAAGVDLSRRGSRRTSR